RAAPRAVRGTHAAHELGGDKAPAKSGDKSPHSKVPRALVLRNASANNLKNLTVQIPLGRLVLVTGVSGSGKSTLIRECLLPALESALKVGRSSSRAKSPEPQSSSRGRSPHLVGHELLKSVYEVDQSPIGR